MAFSGSFHTTMELPPVEDEDAPTEVEVEAEYSFDSLGESASWDSPGCGPEGGVDIVKLADGTEVCPIGQWRMELDETAAEKVIDDYANDFDETAADDRRWGID